MNVEQGTVPTRRFIVRGRVQGVGFRAFVAGRARALRLDGYTRNLPDGRVEIVAQGPAQALECLEEDLATGPALARVEGVERSEPLVTTRFDGFRITH